MTKKLSVGGQAVIEGVMMKGPEKMAVAVRQANGEIAVDVKPVSSIRDRYPFFKKPFLRGVVSLVESLVDGMKALSYSAQISGEEEEKLDDKEMALTITVSVLLAVLLFVVVPTGAMRLLQDRGVGPVALNLVEGFLRLGIFLLYIGGISRQQEIQRVFQYHGAEHKTIYTYEHGLPLVVENVRPFSTLHPRCGTNFLMPVVAGISYEIIRYAGNHIEHPWVRRAILPGLLLQKLTTREPDDSQIEVAIASLKAVLPPDESHEQE